MPANMTQRDERIDLRVSADLKILLSRAAAYSGMSLSSFLISAASDHAKQVIGEHEAVMLSSRDWTAVLTALDEADKPRPRLEAAARRYRERRMSRDAD
jgi:uncharacterized protein (DUF1778 family)